MPELGAACIMFCTLPVTVSSAERSFSKLNPLIKSYLYAHRSPKTVWTVWRISIENEAARQLDLDELVDKFADAKARKKRVLTGWLLLSCEWFNCVIYYCVCSCQLRDTDSVCI